MALGRTDRGNVQAAYGGKATGWALTSASFSPAAGALLVALWAEATTTAVPDITVTTSLSGVGSWTEYGIAVDDTFGNLIHARIAWALCGASPGTGTVTATTNGAAPTAGGMLSVVEFSGHDTTTPIRQNVTGQNASGDTLTLNLASAVLATSMTLSVGNMHGTTGSIVPPSGMTQLTSAQMATGSWAPTFAMDATPPGAQNNQWTGGSVGAVSTGVLIEVAQSTAPAELILPARRRLIISRR